MDVFIWSFVKIVEKFKLKNCDLILDKLTNEETKQIIT